MKQSTTKNTEPIFWTSTQPNYSDKDRVRVSMVNGKRVQERVPQRGHVGEYDNYDYAPGFRSLRVVRHDGHVVDSVLTNGAAHMDTHTTYGQYIRMKHRALGWFAMSECPCALVAAQHIGANTLVHEPSRTAQPCPPGTYSAKAPCPHAVAELDARRRQQAELMSDKEANFKTKEDKIVEQQGKMIEQQSELLERMAGQVSKVDPPAAPKAPRAEAKKD